MNQDQHDVVGEDDSIGGGGGGDGEEEDGGGAVQQHPAGVGKPVGGFSQTSTTNPQSESNHPLPTGFGTLVVVNCQQQPSSSQ